MLMLAFSFIACLHVWLSPHCWRWLSCELCRGRRERVCGGVLFSVPPFESGALLLK